MEIKRAEMIARDLMTFHRLENWSFKFSNAVRLFGYCHYSKKLIALSERLVKMNSEDEVINTILHEIAHALSPKHAHHGLAWKSIAVSIGCTGSRCYGETVEKPSAKYLGVCPKCYYAIKRFRRKNISCGRCDPKFNKALLFVWGAIK